MPLPFLVVFVPLALTVLGAHWGGVWNFLAPAFVFGLVPLLDVVLGHNARNVAGPLPRWVLEAHRALALALWPALTGLLLWAAWLVAHVPMGWVAIAGLTLSVGLCTGGFGITAAHELIHKTSRVDRAVGKLLLLNVAYMHFAIEHVIGHHGRVATPADPASARLGESFYRFLPRTLAGSWLSAREFEHERLKRLGLSRWHWRNQLLWFALLPTAVAAGLALAAGPRAAAFYVAQAAIGFSLLELVNYLEHYGLERQPLENGRYERVTVQHSWSSDQRLTNWFLLNLQRHADHHVNAAKPYPALLHVAEAPQLPTGYPGMVLLALVPPLFLRVMDPRVARVRAAT